MSKLAEFVVGILALMVGITVLAVLSGVTFRLVQVAWSFGSSW